MSKAPETTLRAGGFAWLSAEAAGQSFGELRVARGIRRGCEPLRSRQPVRSCLRGAIVIGPAPSAGRGGRPAPDIGVRVPNARTRCAG